MRSNANSRTSKHAFTFVKTIIHNLSSVFFPSLFLRSVCFHTRICAMYVGIQPGRNRGLPEQTAASFMPNYHAISWFWLHNTFPKKPIGWTIWCLTFRQHERKLERVALLHPADPGASVGCIRAVVNGEAMGICGFFSSTRVYAMHQAPITKPQAKCASSPFKKSSSCDHILPGSDPRKPDELSQTLIV